MNTELHPSTGAADTSSVELETAEPTSRDVEYKRDEKPVEKPLDRKEAIAKAKAELDAKNEVEPAKKEAEKPAEKAEAKTEQKVEEKAKEEPKTPPEKSEGVERAAQEAERPKPSEGKASEAPARFLPRAKELWANTPNPVKEEVHRAISEYEESSKKYETAHKEWSELGQYDQMAKANGTTIKQALDNYTRVDRMLRENPVQGIAEVLKIAGVTPEQYARHVLGQNGQQGAQQGQQRDPQVVSVIERQQQELKALNERLENMQRSQVEAQVENSIIAPFKANHPRYAELEPQMATILNSGLVPQNLTPFQKLEAAYDMAERLNPRSVSSDPLADVGPDVTARREKSAGGKSIKGAPTPGTENGNRKGQIIDRKAAINAARAELGL